MLVFMFKNCANISALISILLFDFLPEKSILSWFCYFVVYGVLVFNLMAFLSFVFCSENWRYLILIKAKEGGFVFFDKWYHFFNLFEISFYCWGVLVCFLDFGLTPVLISIIVFDIVGVFLYEHEKIKVLDLIKERKKR